MIDIDDGADFNMRVIVETRNVTHATAVDADDGESHFFISGDCPHAMRGGE